MLLIRLLFLILLMLYPLGAKIISSDTLILGANEAPPFWSKTLPYNGMAGEIIHEMSKVANIDTKIEFKPLARLIEDDANNDLGNPSFYINNQDFAAIIPIAIYNVSIYYYAPNHTNKFTFKSIEDLRGMKIGILKGTIVNRSYFTKYGVEFEESYKQESLFRKLKLGRIDMIIEVELVSKQILNKEFSNEIDNFVEIILPKSSYPIAIMLSEDLPNVDIIKKNFHNALRTIIDNGVYISILHKYYPNKEIPKNWFQDLQRFRYLYKQEE